MTLYSYNWSVDLGTALNRDLVRLVKWQNARAHVVHCLLNQKMGLFHHHCFSDAPIHEMESKQVKTQLRQELLFDRSLLISSAGCRYRTGHLQRVTSEQTKKHQRQKTGEED